MMELLELLKKRRASGLEAESRGGAQRKEARLANEPLSPRARIVFSSRLQRSFFAFQFMASA
jgi:hypothetical protein